MNPSLTPEQVQGLQAWTGRTDHLNDTATLAPARGLAATLDQASDTHVNEALLPPLWHWLYFLPQAPQSQIGPDGHPRRGGFLPPVPLPRRMWAGSQLRWFADNPLRLGQALERHSRIASVEHKQGRSGEMVFVKVEHTVHNPHGPALQEFHDIVYRHASPPGEPGPAGVPADTGAPWQRAWLPDAVMLFRYSALTFNGHQCRGGLLCSDSGLSSSGNQHTACDALRQLGRRPIAFFGSDAQRTESAGTGAVHCAISGSDAKRPTGGCAECSGTAAWAPPNSYRDFPPLVYQSVRYQNHCT